MANLSKANRDALPGDEFAVPGKRKLPIHDAAHVRLAWDMVDRAKDLSDDERREARERIIRKAGSLGISTEDWRVEASIAFQAMAIAMPDVEGHPNRKPFKGVLTRVDQPSDAPPGGSGGRRVIIPSDVARQALPSLLGMGVDCDPEGNFDGHDARFKIGLITAADVVGDAVEIEGFFYANDFPDIWEAIQAEKHALGFSYECKVRIRDLDAEFWVAESCVFTGAALLYKAKAAYQTTSLAAKAESENQSMNEEQLKQLLAGMSTMQDGITRLTAEVAEIKAGRGASLAGPVIDQVKPHVDAINACAASMDAAGVGTDPKAGHAGVLRRVAAHMAAEAVSGRVPMVYRDHDYLPDARVEASADPKAIEAAQAAAMKPLQDALADLGTKFADLKASAFNSAPAPERKTLSPEIMTLLAKAGIAPDEAKDKVSVSSIDKTLEAAGIKGRSAIEAKLKLMHAGLLPAGKPEA